MKWALPLLILALLATALPCSARFPEIQIPTCFGVQGPSPLGPGLDPAELDRLADAGFRLIRMDLQWEKIEKEKGVYDFTTTPYDAFTEAYTKRGIRILYILDYGNRLYEGTDKSVRTEEGRKAFAAFAEAAAKRYAGKGVIYEIWNEPNIFFWDPQPSTDDYLSLVKETAPRIKAADSTAMIIGPASSRVPMDWLDELFKKGLLNWVDGVSVHPYRAGPPETVIDEYARLREMIKKYAPENKPVRILSTEWGYSLLNWDRTPLTEEQQADRLVRMFLVDLSENVPVSIWFDWKDWGTDPNILEHHSGVMLPGGEKPKKAFFAMKTMSSLLKGASLEKKLDLGSKDDFALKLKSDTSEIVAFWTTGSEHEVTLPIRRGKGDLYDIYGKKVSPLSWGMGGPKVKLSQSPLYLIMDKRYTSFRPGDAWYDTDGVKIEAHGGGMYYEKGTYYWFGEHGTPGRTEVGVMCYSSKDLYNWKNEGCVVPLVKDDPKHDLTLGCALERPKVIYNAKTKKYVMWFHLELKDRGYDAALSAVAISDKVTGSYKYLGSFRPNDSMARDQTVFVDGDGKGYQFYASDDNRTMHISLLTDDYLRPSGKFVPVFVETSTEAPSVFRYKGKYYFMGSACTAYAPNAARSAVADSIRGPWTQLGNPCVGKNAEYTFNSQSTYILPVAGKPGAFIYMGDRWSGGRYVWLPILLENGKFRIEWTDEWDLSVFDKGR